MNEIERDYLAANALGLGAVVLPHAESPSPSLLSSITSSPVVASMKSGWSALPQKTKLIIATRISIEV